MCEIGYVRPWESGSTCLIASISQGSRKQIGRGMVLNLSCSVAWGTLKSTAAWAPFPEVQFKCLVGDPYFGIFNFPK